MNKQKRRKHSEEFKREVIEFGLSSPKPIRQICKEFGIAPSQYYLWRARLLGSGEAERAVGEGGLAASKQAMADEIRALGKELEAVKRQREILKKAAIILGQSPQTDMR